VTAPRLLFTISAQLRWRVPALLAALLLACGSGDPLQSVREQQAKGNFQASLEPLRELLAKTPDDPEVQFRYGRALRALGELSMAQWALMRALENPDWERRAAFELGTLNLQSGNWNQAIEAMNRILEDDPENIPALEFRANVRLRSRNQYQEALEDAELIALLDPGNENVLAIRTVALMGLNEKQDAKAALAELEKHFRESPSEALAARYCTAHAMFAAVEERLDDAETLFLGCFGSFPGAEVTFSGLLDFYESSGRQRKIIPFLTDQVRANPEEAAYRTELVARLETAGDFNSAEALLKVAVERASETDRVPAWFELGRHYMLRGNYDSAVETAAKVVAAVPEPTSFMLAYHAEALILANRLEEALDAAKKIPVATHRELVRGRVAYARDDCETAQAHFEEALGLWPENAVARFFNGRCAEELGDFDRAIEDYRYSMRADPRATDARLRLARILAAQRDGASVLHVMRHGGNFDIASMRPELAVIGIESLARFGTLSGLQNTLDDIRGRVGAVMWARVLAGVTRGFEERFGPEPAITFLLEREGLDFDRAENILLVDRLAELESAAGRPADAVLRTSRSLEQEGAKAARLEIHAGALARNGAPAAEVIAVYRQALVANSALPRSARALAHFHNAAGRTEAALAQIDAVLAEDGMAQNPVLMRERARWLAELARVAEAQSLLLDLLRENPTDFEAATLLANLYGKPGGSARQAHRYARQAARFGASEDPSAAAAVPSAP
jgi:tetratricopeptide (TPR) repeat protein